MTHHINDAIADLFKKARLVRSVEGHRPAKHLEEHNPEAPHVGGAVIAVRGGGLDEAARALLDANDLRSCGGRIGGGGSAAARVRPLRGTGRWPVLHAATPENLRVTHRSYVRGESVGRTSLTNKMWCTAEAPEVSVRPRRAHRCRGGFSFLIIAAAAIPNPHALTSYFSRKPARERSRSET